MNVFSGQLDLVFSTGMVRQFNYCRAGVPPFDFQGVVDSFPARLIGVNPGDLRIRARAQDFVGVVGVGAPDTLEDSQSVQWEIVGVYPEFNGEGVTFQVRRPAAVVPSVTFSFPVVTKAQRNALTGLVAGMGVFQSDNTPGLRVFNGANWVRFTETID